MRGPAAVRRLSLDVQGNALAPAHFFPSAIDAAPPGGAAAAAVALRDAPHVRRFSINPMVNAAEAADSARTDGPAAVQTFQLDSSAKVAPPRCTRKRVAIAAAGMGAGAVCCCVALFGTAVCGLIAAIAAIDLAATGSGWRFPAQRLEIIDMDANPMRFALALDVTNPAAVTTVGVRDVAATLHGVLGGVLGTLGGVASARFAPGDTTWRNDGARVALELVPSKQLIESLTDPGQPHFRQRVVLRAAATIWAVAPLFASRREFEVPIELCNVFRAANNVTCTTLLKLTELQPGGDPACSGMTLSVLSPLCERQSEAAAAGSPAAAPTPGAAAAPSRATSFDLVAVTVEGAGAQNISVDATFNITREAGVGFTLVAATVPHLAVGMWRGDAGEVAAQQTPLVTVATVAQQRYDAITSPLLTFSFTVAHESARLLKGVPRVDRVGFVPPTAESGGGGDTAVLQALFAASGAVFEVCAGARTRVGLVFPRGHCFVAHPPRTPDDGSSTFAPHELDGPTYSELWWAGLRLSADTFYLTERDRQKDASAGTQLKPAKAKKVTMTKFKWRSGTLGETALEFGLGWNDAAPAAGGLGPQLADAILGKLPPIHIQLHGVVPSNRAGLDAPCVHAAANAPSTVSLELKLESTMHGIGRFGQPGGIDFLLSVNVGNRTLLEHNWLARLLSGETALPSYLAACGTSAMAQFLRSALPTGEISGLRVPKSLLHSAWHYLIRVFGGFPTSSVLSSTSASAIELGFQASYIPLGLVGAPKTIEIERIYASLDCDGIEFANMETWIEKADFFGLTYNLGTKTLIEVSGGVGGAGASPMRLASERCVAAILQGRHSRLSTRLKYSGFEFQLDAQLPELKRYLCEPSGAALSLVRIGCDAGSSSSSNGSVAHFAVHNGLPFDIFVHNVSAVWSGSGGGSSGGDATASWIPPVHIFELLLPRGMTTSIGLQIVPGSASSLPNCTAQLPKAHVVCLARLGMATMVLHLDESTTEPIVCPVV